MAGPRDGVFHLQPWSADAPTQEWPATKTLLTRVSYSKEGVRGNALPPSNLLRPNSTNSNLQLSVRHFPCLSGNRGDVYMHSDIHTSQSGYYDILPCMYVVMKCDLSEFLSIALLITHDVSNMQKAWACNACWHFADMCRVIHTTSRHG